MTRRMIIKHRFFLIVFTAIVAVGAAFFFLIFPLRQKVRGLTQTIQEERANFEAISQERIDRIRSERNLKTMEKYRSVLNQTLIPQKENLTFIAALEELAERHEVQNQKIDLTPPQPLGAPFPTSVLTLQFEAPFVNLLTWWKDLEHESFYLLIDTVQLQRSTALREEQSNQILVVIQAKVIWQ